MGCPFSPPGAGKRDPPLLPPRGVREPPRPPLPFPGGRGGGSISLPQDPLRAGAHEVVVDDDTDRQDARIEARRLLGDRASWLGFHGLLGRHCRG